MSLTAVFFYFPSKFQITKELRTMQYLYLTATGPVAIELDERYIALLDAFDDAEDNSNRKHSRRHPISLEHASYEGAWFEDKADPIGDAETAIDAERAMTTLTELQQTCFAEVCMNDRTQRNVAAELGKSKYAVTQAIEGARKKLKKVF